ncbi:MAG: SIMPL domain-containing protein [Bacillota bacterium]
MKNIIPKALSIMVFFIVLGFLLGGIAVAEEDQLQYTTVNLNINQQEKYTPDIVDVVVGFENENPIHEKAIRENNKVSQELMDILKSKDLENIQTQRFRVYPRTRYDSKNQNKKIDYYNVSNQIKFTSKNLSDLPVLLGELLEAGANNVQSINYRLENNNEELEAVTDLALKNLQTKAENITNSLGKEKYEIEDINFGHQRVYTRGLQESMPMAKTMSAGSSSNVPVSEQEVEINVSLSAKIRVY